MNEVPIQQYYALPYDRWEGYEAERQELLAYLQDEGRERRLPDRRRAREPGQRRPLQHPRRRRRRRTPGILDVDHRPDRDRDLRARDQRHRRATRARAPLVHDLFFKPQPPNGVGMQCAAMDQFSYAQVEVTKSRLTVDLLDANDQPVLDTGDSTDARRAALRAGRDPEAVAGRADRGALSRRRRRRRPLRELLHQGDPAGRRRGRSGSATRSTSAPARSSTGSLWFTLFDADAPGPRATKLTVRRARGRRPRRRLHRGRRRAAGARARARRARDRRAMSVAWELEFEHGAGGVSPPALRVPLPGRRCRRRSSSRPHPTPASRARSRSTASGSSSTVAGDDRPQLGRRARRALDLDPGERAFAAPTAGSTPALGRIKVGPMTTPWIGNAMLQPRRRAAPARRLRPHPLDQDRRGADRAASSSSAASEIKVRGRVALGAAQLRRLGLRRSRGGPSTTRSTARSPTSS